MKGSVSWADSAIPAEVRNKYEFHNYGHALEILHMACVEEWGDVLAALRQFQIKRSDIFAAGGSESAIPKKFSNILFPRGWQEIKFSGDLHVRVYQRTGGLIEEKIVTNLIDAGVIVTRAEELNDIFRQLNVISKYGASTTWMGKLTPRLDSRRQGGCPVLAIGIKKECVIG